MDLFSKYNLTFGKIAKLFGAGVACVVVLALLLSIVSSAFKGTGFSARLLSKVSNEMAYGGAVASAPMMYQGSAGYDGGAGLSIRNAMPAGESGSVGDDAEEYEVVEYSASIETRTLADDCAVIMAMKADDDIIFEQSSESEHACYYTFKVRKPHVVDVLAVLSKLDPKDLSESTQTIKGRLDDFTSELQILEQKQKSIDATLESALKSYQDITLLATRTQDVESLARIIESKIQIIERLTQERLRINEQLDRLSRAKAEQLDRLEYASFHVTVVENLYFDGERIKDSWKASLRHFFDTANKAVQDATINVLAVLFVAVQYVIYLLLILVLAKYGWRFAKYVWQK